MTYRTAQNWAAACTRSMPAGTPRGIGLLFGALYMSVLRGVRR